MSEKTTITAEVPAELNAELQRIADMEGRSKSSQVRRFLGDSIMEWQKRHGRPAASDRSRRVERAP
jgi:predicted transcriptional regulator